MKVSRRLAGKGPQDGQIGMCRPSSKDVGLGKAVAVVLVVAVAAAIAKPALHVAETVLQVVLITAAVAAGVAAMAAVAVFVIRVHRRQSHALQALPVARAVAARQPAPAIPAAQRLAIEPPQQSAAEALGLEEPDEAERDLIRRP